MEFTQVVFKKNKKKCFLLKMEKRLPGINAHNSFAKIIKNLFQDNFVFSGRDEDSDCWSEKRNLKENPMNYVLSATGRKYVSTKKIKYRCVDCEGSQICGRKRRKDSCRECKV